jgi:hypothetical protein
MFIPDPDLCLSRISDTKTATKEKGKKCVVLPFFIPTNIPKIINYFSFEQVTKKIWGKFTKNDVQNSLPITLSLNSQKYGLRTRDPEKTYSGTRIQGPKRHRIPDPQHWV